MESDFNYHGPVVVFDLDDTLFRERDFCRSGFRFLLDNIRNRLDFVPEGLFERMDRALCERRSPFDCFEAELKPLFESAGKEWDLAALITAYRNHSPRINLSDGVVALLNSLRERGVVTGIITDGRSSTQRNKFRALNLNEFIDESNLIISEETGFDKTSPEPFSFFVRKYPEARKFLYVADNPEKDFFQPNLLGWTTVMVPENGDNVHPRHLTDDSFCNPAFSVNNPAEILKLIDG